MAETNVKFDLAAVNMKAFGKQNMFNKKWYLRRERLVAYTITQMLGMAAQGAATYCMFKYKNLRHHIQNFSHHTAKVHDNDIFVSAVLSMTFPAVLSVFLALEYFLLLFWPANVYPRWWNRTKIAVVVGSTVATGATIILSTVVVSSHMGTISGVDAATATMLTNFYFRPPLNYHTWPQNIAWVVLTWLCFVSSLVSMTLMLVAQAAESKAQRNRAQVLPDSEDVVTEVLEKK